MNSVVGPAIKSVAFVLVTAFATTMLALTITNGAISDGRDYRAIFSDATSLNAGDDVRMAGVRIGQVTSVTVTDRALALVDFTIDPQVRLARTVSATIRFRNLIGQRYVELDEGDGPLDPALTGGATIRNTTPALDLTVLFNGFQPLFQALSPQQINDLTAEIIAVFQGEGPTIGNLVAQTAQLTNALADKDQVIGEVVDNLSAVLKAVNGRGDQLGTLISTLRSFVSGLAQDRQPLGEAVSAMGALTTDVADLLGQARKPLAQSIAALGSMSANLAGSANALNSFLQTVPGKLATLMRPATYGSWLNFYVCTIGGRIPVPAEYGTVPYKQYAAPAGQPPYPFYPVGPPDPSGMVGVDNPAARCTR
jgi:phospholipid/cholesterol/gamma-HCH transport system substrate-binding protein